MPRRAGGAPIYHAQLEYRPVPRLAAPPSAAGRMLVAPARSASTRRGSRGHGSYPAGHSGRDRRASEHGRQRALTRSSASSVTVWLDVWPFIVVPAQPPARDVGRAGRGSIHAVAALVIGCPVSKGIQQPRLIGWSPSVTVAPGWLTTHRRAGTARLHTARVERGTGAIHAGRSGVIGLPVCRGRQQPVAHTLVRAGDCGAGWLRRAWSCLHELAACGKGRAPA